MKTIFKIKTFYKAGETFKYDIYLKLSVVLFFI